ncbi:MAG: MipA/OmpV family protein [Hyphomicrobium sp.]
MISTNARFLAAALFAVSFAPVAAAQSSIDLQAGGAAVVTPKYEGSKEYEVRGFPIVAPAGAADGSDGGFVQFRGIDDVRFRALNYSGLEFGPLAGYRFGRDEDDADRLNGLGDVDGGLVVGAYVAYNFGMFKPFLSYHHQVTGDDAGSVMRFGAETRFALTSGVALTAIAGASYADDDYNSSYFGVTAAQSAASGLAVHDADSGIKDVYLSLGTDIPLTDVISLKLGARYAHLLGDAADSSIVETDHQFSGLVGLTYKFSLPR